MTYLHLLIIFRRRILHITASARRSQPVYNTDPLKTDKNDGHTGHVTGEPSNNSFDLPMRQFESPHEQRGLPQVIPTEQQVQVDFVEGSSSNTALLQPTGIPMDPFHIPASTNFSPSPFNFWSAPAPSFDSLSGWPLDSAGTDDLLSLLADVPPNIG